MNRYMTSLRPALLTLLILLVLGGIWEAAITTSQGSGELSEYEMMMGGGQPSAGVPLPSQVLVHAWNELSNPFYDNGPNDKGIGIQLGYSIGRVLLGFSMAAAIAIPLGFVIGMSPLMYKALNPFIQVLRPVSPLAWMPLALFIIKDSIEIIVPSFRTFVTYRSRKHFYCQICYSTNLTTNQCFS